MAEIEFTKSLCSECGGHIEFPKSAIGIAIECPHCSATITLSSNSNDSPSGLGPSEGDKPTVAYINTSDGEVLGHLARSPNQEFTLVSCDRWAGGHDGEKGSFYLFKNSIELCKGFVQRPNDAHVANDGAFVFCDWLFTKELTSVFYAFNCTGEVLIKKKFRANLLSASISPGGEFAACQTAVNRNSGDSELLTLFDLRSHNEVWRLYPPLRAETYEFNVESNQLTICWETPNSIFKSAVLKLTPLPSRNRKPKATK